MKIRHDDRFRAERAQYQLRFCCEECSFFDVEHARCAHGYPAGPHRLARYESGQADLVFCKHFELV